MKQTIKLAVLILLSACSQVNDKEEVAKKIDVIKLPDGTRCVAYIVPVNRIRGISCDFSTTSETNN